MNSETLFYIILSILVIDYLFDSLLNFINYKHYGDQLPQEVNDVFDQEEYIKSQQYKKENFKVGRLKNFMSIAITVLFISFDGFKYVDDLARNISENELVIALLFFGIIMLASDILFTPFSYYRTFTIEEKYGFNKMTKKMFWLDKLKGLGLSIILGGVIMSLIILFYQLQPNTFWLYAWGLVALFTVLMNALYSTVIVPLFNKQTPLEEGELKTAIEAFAKKVDFKLDNIFVIDGSKRSTKANAYFAGIGSTKRIVLYDTLINDLTTEEIVAVLAHEVGHYKKKHVLFNLFSAIITTGITFYILSVVINNPLLSNALGVDVPSFHIGLTAFGLLYSPISMITGIIMNAISRKFEYQADDYAKYNYDGKYLVSSLKKLTKKSLSNLTPHKSYVFVHYSHPTLRSRIVNLYK